MTCLTKKSFDDIEIAQHRCELFSGAVAFAFLLTIVSSLL